MKKILFFQIHSYSETRSISQAQAYYSFRVLSVFLFFLILNPRWVFNRQSLLAIHSQWVNQVWLVAQSCATRVVQIRDRSITSSQIQSQERGLWLKRNLVPRTLHVDSSM